MFDDIISFVRHTFREPEAFIPLHAPFFGGNEKTYLSDTIDSTFVSSVGAFVNRFEEMMAAFTGAGFAVATTNGTSALHLALAAAGVRSGDEVITQPLSFVATANAVSYCSATPVFIDVDRDTMGMSPEALKDFLKKNTQLKNGICVNRHTGRKIAACVPMHTYGFPCRIDEIAIVCHEYNIPLVEDCAESLGSFYKGKHTGNFGMMGTFSFNGNKIITCGGGGAVITSDEVLAKRLKHLSTTAKLPHSWAFSHDETGFNYRMPNLNAALACAQLEQLPQIILNKKNLAETYRSFFENSEIRFVIPIKESHPNFWLNTLIFPDKKQRDHFLETSLQAAVMTRPAWDLLSSLPMFRDCWQQDLSHAAWLEERVVNIPSSHRPFALKKPEEG